MTEFLTSLCVCVCVRVWIFSYPRFYPRANNDSPLWWRCRGWQHHRCPGSQLSFWHRELFTDVPPLKRQSHAADRGSLPWTAPPHPEALASVWPSIPNMEVFTLHFTNEMLCFTCSATGAASPMYSTLNSTEKDCPAVWTLTKPSYLFCQSVYTLNKNVCFPCPTFRL